MLGLVWPGLAALAADGPWPIVANFYMPNLADGKGSGLASRDRLRDFRQRRHSRLKVNGR